MPSPYLKCNNKDSHKATWRILEVLLNLNIWWTHELVFPHLENAKGFL